MSKYTMYYAERQKMYREFAASWAKFTANMELTERQRRGKRKVYRGFF